MISLPRVNRLLLCTAVAFFFAAPPAAAHDGHGDDESWEDYEREKDNHDDDHDGDKHGKKHHKWWKHADHKFKKFADKDKEEKFDGKGKDCECKDEHDEEHACPDSQNVPPCGDGKLDLVKEECDDGNVEPDDGCSALCKIENPLDCSVVDTTPFVLWPPDHRFVKVAVSSVKDFSGGPTDMRIVGLRQDEDPLGNDCGETCPDGVLLPDGTANLRAERDSALNGRVYHVRFRADAPSGDACVGVVTVCVPPTKDEPCVTEGANFDSLTCPAEAKKSFKKGKFRGRGHAHGLKKHRHKKH